MSALADEPGVRVVTVTFPLIARFFEYGWDRGVPLAPVKLRILAARQSPRWPHDMVELLVESESFPDDGGRTWETAKRHDATFRRWPESGGVWTHSVPEGAVEFRLTLRFADGHEVEVRLPEGAVEFCAYDEEPMSALVRDRDGKYQHVPLVKVAPSEPSEGPPV